MSDVDHASRSLREQYEIQEEIGRGGSAVVYAAHDRRHDRRVALKILQPDIASPVVRERFQREIRIVASLQHPNILPLFDSGEVDGSLFFVMPLVRGETLHARLEREGPLPLDLVCKLVGGIAAALDYAHESGVVHRDLKPDNVFLSGEHALVADFGIARLLTEGGEPGLTRTGTFVGTPAYLSPEQVSGAEVDARSDVYALGCLAYAMLAGEPPFTGRTAQSVAAKHVLSPVPSLRVVRPSVPADMEQAVLRALKKTPADRFGTAGELAEAMAESLAAAPGFDRSTTTPEVVLPPRSRAFRTAVRVVNAIGILAVVAWGWWFLARPGPAPLDPDRVVVFPFADGLGGTNEGLLVSSMILSALDHADFLRPVDGWSRLSGEQREDIAMLSPEQARAIARDRGAAYYLHGRVAAVADSVTVSLMLQDVAADTTVAMASARAAAGSTGSVQAGLHGLIRLLPEWIDPGRAFDLSTLTERAPAAVATWMRGERAYRFARFDEARALYNEAVAADSLLVMAALKGAAAAHWMDRLEEAEDLVGLATARESLLPSRYAHLARGLDHYLAGEADWAAAEFRAALETSPDWAEAWMALGETYYHLFPADVPSSAPFDSVPEASFRAARRFDPGFAPPLYHLTEITLRRGDLAAADTFLAAYTRQSPERTSLLTLGAMRSCVGDGPGATDWSRVIGTDRNAAYDAAKSLAAGGAQPACAAEGFRAILAAEAAPENWGAILGLQGVLVATGRPQDAAALLDDAVAGGSRVASVLYVIDALAGAPFQNRAADVDALVRSIYGDDYAGGRLETLWLLGSWRASLGQVDAARVIRSEMDRDESDPEYRRSVVLGRAVSAQIALAGGDTATALDRFAELRPSGPYKELVWDYAEPLAVSQLTYARLLLSLGRYEEALARASVFDHQQPIIYLPFLPSSLTIRREAAVHLGRQDLAQHYARRLESLALAGDAVARP